MELRTYQTECIDTIEAQPPGAYLAQMATGLGKTVSGLSAVQDVPAVPELASHGLSG